MSESLATFAGGCFWCLEAVFEMLRGVDQVESGYMGGHVPHPTYQQVCSGETGHAEVVQLTFDPSIIRYRDLLDVFFTIHDPTTLNRQGNDVGTQYRSAIFYHTADQKAEAEASIAEWNASQTWPLPIVTVVTPASQFWKAEDYHQGYYRSHPQQPYCVFVVGPKVSKARQAFVSLLKDAPVRV